MLIEKIKSREGAERDNLNQLPLNEIVLRIQLGERVIGDAIKECVATDKIQEVIRQVGVLKKVLIDRQSQIVPSSKKKIPEGIVVDLKPVNLFVRSGKNG